MTRAYTTLSTRQTARTTASLLEGTRHRAGFDRVSVRLTACFCTSLDSLRSEKRWITTLS